ncbi:MAG: alpha/beta hydrolase [Eubacterium sp.]|nr:alpha/beta hydrolase [Eubacterium sp.]
MTMQRGTVVAADFTMDYFCFGSGSQTMVILPGLSVQSVMGAAAAIAEEYAVMAEAFTVYVFDRRNELPDLYSVSDMAEDTATAIRRLGLKNICLFGASQGGMIAMTVAARYPSLVSKLALCSTAASVREEAQPVIGQWIALAEKGDREGLYLSFGKAVYPPAVFASYRAALVAAAAGVTEEELKRFVILATGTVGFDATRELSAIACPVLIAGDQTDAVLGVEATHAIASLLRDRPCTLLLYDGYGHAVYDTAPDFRQRLYDFFTEKIQ